MCAVFVVTDKYNMHGGCYLSLLICSKVIIIILLLIS